MDSLEVKADLTATDEGIIAGIAWPFALPDKVGDVIQKGAVRVPGDVPMYFAHKTNARIGTWSEVTETDTGIEVKGRLDIETNPFARQVYENVRAGKVTGLSIGFDKRGFTRRPEGGRNLTSIDLNEISIAPSPVHQSARIIEVKSADAAIEDLMTDAVTETKNDSSAVETQLAELNANFGTLTGRLDKLEARQNRPGVASETKAEALSDLQERAFEAYLRSPNDATPIPAEFLSEECKAFTVASPGTGGVLVPPERSKKIVEKLAEFSPVRTIMQKQGSANIIPVTSGLFQLPRLTDEIEPGEVTEVATRPEDQPEFELLDIKPYEMAVIVPISQIAVEDAMIDVGAYVGNHVAKVFGQRESMWFVTGNGITQATGVMTDASVPVVETAGGGELTADDLIDTFYAIKSGYSANGAWLMRKETIAKIRKLKDGDGNYIWTNGLAGTPGMILGAPVYESVHMPALAEGASPIVFGDFGEGYMIIDRIGYRAKWDDLTGWGNGLLKLHARRRVGGRVVLPEALVKLKIKAA